MFSIFNPALVGADIFFGSVKNGQLTLSNHVFLDQILLIIELVGNVLIIFRPDDLGPVVVHLAHDRHVPADERLCLFGQ